MTDSSDEKLRETIDQSPLFKHLSKDWRQRLVDSSHVQTYESGEAIIEEGQDVQHHLYIVLEGQVRVWTQSPKREVELKTLRPGAYFGEVSLLSDKHATATVEAKSDTLSILAIEREIIAELVDADEKVRQMLEGITLARAKDTIGKVLD